MPAINRLGIRSWSLAALLLVVTVMIYSPCLRGDFLWDDDAYISHNAELTTPHGLHDIWLTPGSVQQYYPLTFTLFWIEYHLWGLNPLGYHLVSVLGHGLNAVLIWIALETLGISGGWMAACFFALHPVHTESVAWMTELKNVLSTFFSLLAIVFVIRFYRVKDSSPIHYSLALFFFFCALLSKSVTVTLPVSFLAVCAWIEGKTDKRKVLHMLPFVFLGLGLGLYTLSYEHHQVGAQGIPWVYTAGERCLIAGHAFWFYLSKLADPSHLTFVYPRWTFNTLGWLYPITALIFLGLLAYGKRWWGKLPFACLLFFAISLSPMLGFTSFYFMRYSFVADHFQYLASIGLFALAGWAMEWGLGRLQVPAFSPLGALVVFMICLNLAIRTNRETRKYMNSSQLWQETLQYNPDSAIAHHNMGIALADQQKWNLAVAHLRTAEALDPSYPQTHLALAYFAAKAKRWDDARHQYEEAIRLGIRDPEVLKDFSNLPGKNPFKTK